jgi:hypothetical protein
VTPEGQAEVRVIAGEPDGERTYRVIELLTAGSIERLWITDAYLVAPARLLQGLRDAAKDGVDVRLLVPGSSDLPLVRNLSRIGYRELPAKRCSADLRVGRPDAARQDHRGRWALGPGGVDQPESVQSDRELRAGTCWWKTFALGEPWSASSDSTSRAVGR